MIEDRDGSFGAIRPAQEIIDQLKELGAGITDEMRAVHFETPEELAKKRQEHLETIVRQGFDDLGLKYIELERKLNRIMIHHGIRIMPSRY